MRCDRSVNKNARHRDARAVGFAVHVAHDIARGIQCVHGAINTVHRVVTDNVICDIGHRVIVDCRQLRRCCNRIDPAEADGRACGSGVDRDVSNNVVRNGVRL